MTIGPVIIALIKYLAQYLMKLILAKMTPWLLRKVAYYFVMWRYGLPPKEWENILTGFMVDLENDSKLTLTQKYQSLISFVTAEKDNTKIPLPVKDSIPAVKKKGKSD